MAWSVKAQVKECGHYWMNEKCCGLAFICALCEEGLSTKVPTDTLAFRLGSITSFSLQG